MYVYHTYIYIRPSISPPCKVINMSTFRGLRLFSASNLFVRGCSSASQGVRKKHKIPQKRATKLHNELKHEMFAKLKNGREWPQIRAGDAVAVQRLENMSATEPDTIKGVVISKTNRFSDTAITLINTEYGTPILRRIVLYNPLITNVEIIQRAFIHKGKKRVRRSKLYYLADRDPSTFTVTY